MGQAARILIVDSNPVEREGLKLIAQKVDASIIVDSAETVIDAERLAARHRYQLAVLDLGLPGSRGFSCFLQLQHRLAKVPIILLSDEWTPALVESARALGAAAYLTKSEPLDGVRAVIQAVFSGQVSFPSLQAPVDVIRDAHRAVQSLSSAQLRVLSALAAGRSNKQIAGDLGVTEATIKAHLSASFRKLGVQNRAQALLAMQPLFQDDPSRPASPLP